MNDQKKGPGRPKGSGKSKTIIQSTEPIDLDLDGNGYLVGDMDIMTLDQLRDENIRLKKMLKRLGSKPRNISEPEADDRMQSESLEEVCLILKRWSDPAHLSKIFSFEWNCKTSSFQWKYKRSI